MQRVFLAALALALASCADTPPPNPNRARWEAARQEGRMYEARGDLAGARATYANAVAMLAPRSSEQSAAYQHLAAVLAADGDQEGALKAAINCYTGGKSDTFCALTQKAVREGAYTKAGLMARANAPIAHDDDVGGDSISRPSPTPPPMVIAPNLPPPIQTTRPGGAAVGGVTPGSNTSPTAGRGASRTYCTGWQFETNNDGLRFVRFQNNCPIAVVIGWCEVAANGTCKSSGGTRSIPPTGTYRTNVLSKETVSIRHLGCSDQATGYDTSPGKPEWSCGPDRK